MSRAVVHVGLGDRAYEVLVGPGLIDGAGGLIAPLLKRRRVAVVTDNIVGDYHGERLAFALERGGVSEFLTLRPFRNPSRRTLGTLNQSLAASIELQA